VLVRIVLSIILLRVCGRHARRLLPIIVVATAKLEYPPRGDWLAISPLFLQLLAQVRFDALQSFVYRPLRNAQPLGNRPLGEALQQMPRGDLSVSLAQRLQRLPQGAGEDARHKRLLRGWVFVFYRFACLFVAGRVALALGRRPDAVAEAFQALPNYPHAPFVERAATIGVVGRMREAGSEGSLVVEFLAPAVGVGARGDVGRH